MPLAFHWSDTVTHEVSPPAATAACTRACNQLSHARKKRTEALGREETNRRAAARHLLLIASSSSSICTPSCADFSTDCTVRMSFGSSLSSRMRSYFQPPFRTLG